MKVPPQLRTELSCPTGPLLFSLAEHLHLLRVWEVRQSSSHSLPNGLFIMFSEQEAHY